MVEAAVDRAVPQNSLLRGSFSSSTGGRSVSLVLDYKPKLGATEDEIEEAVEGLNEILSGT